MIVAAPGWSASYRHEGAEGTPWWSYRRVVAWDDERRPLVVDDKNGGILVLASGIKDFETVDLDGEMTIAVIPADGRWRLKRDGRGTDPVVAWALRADGRLLPMSLCHDEIIAHESADDLVESSDF